MDLTNFRQSTILFAILGLLIFVYAHFSISRRRRNKTTPRKPPPEAGGAWPVIGHLRLLGGPEPPHITLSSLVDKYGPIFTVRLGVHQTLIMNSWEIAKECFTVNDRAFASRPKLVSFEVMGYNFGMIGFSPYGAYWRHVRKIATLEVLSNHRLEMLKHVRESEVKSAMKDTYDRWLGLNKNGENIEAVPLSCEMKNWFGEITLNAVFRMVVGKRFAETEGKEMTQKALRDLFDLSGSFVISDALPYLRWQDLGGQERAMRKTAKELDQFIQFLLDEHRRNRDDGGSGRGKPKHSDFMDMLVSSVDEGEKIDGHDADSTIKATSLAIILAATDTTTVTLTWAPSLLMNNPQVLKKAVHELDTQVGKERLVVESDVKNLPYLQAILKETMRLYPAAPLGVIHESLEDCTVAGYHIPSGTRLMTNLSKIHRDPRVYEDPLEFKPERFLTTHKNVDLRGQHFELIPFGAGRRMCPGISFALQITQLTLASALHGFDIATPDSHAVDMREQVGLTNIKASPLHVLLTPRLSTFLSLLEKMPFNVCFKTLSTSIFKQSSMQET